MPDPSRTYRGPPAYAAKSQKSRSAVKPSDWTYHQYTMANKNLHRAYGPGGNLAVYPAYLEYSTARSRGPGARIRDYPGASSFMSFQRLYSTVANGAPNPITTIKDFDGCQELFYHPDSCNHSKQLKVGLEWRHFEFDPRTTFPGKGQFRPQLDESLIAGIGHDLITPALGEDILVDFPNVPGKPKPFVRVLYASKKSESPALTALHAQVYDERHVGELDSCLSELLPDNALGPRTSDPVGGGQLLLTGFGVRGEAPFDAIADRRQWTLGMPFALASSNLRGFDRFHRVLGGIMGRVAHAVMVHDPPTYQRNVNFMSLNPNVCFPSQHMQDRAGLVYWGAAQVAVRQVGTGIDLPKHGRGYNIGSLHYDPGDVAEVHPLVYIPSCRRDHRGGNVADSDLVVFQHQFGGKSVRIKTNVRDTVCIVLFNANYQLHGVVRGDGSSDTDAWVNRLVPYTQHRTACWMRNNPNALPFDTYKNILKPCPW